MGTISQSNEPLAKEISNVIKEKGLKQAYVAKKAGYEAQELSDMLNGRRLIRACDIPRIAYGLGIGINELFKKELEKEAV